MIDQFIIKSIKKSMKWRILALLTFQLQVIRAALTNFANGADAIYLPKTGHSSSTTNDNSHSSNYESSLLISENDIFALFMHQTVSVATVFIDGPEDQWIDIGIGDGFDPTQYSTCVEDVVLLGVHECIGTGSKIIVKPKSTDKFFEINEIYVYDTYDVSKYATVSFEGGQLTTPNENLSNLVGAQCYSEGSIFRI